MNTASPSLIVELGERSYPIYIGANLLSDGDMLRSNVSSAQVLIVSNKTLAPLYLDRVVGHFPKTDYQCAVHVIPDGECHKTLQCLEGFFTALMRHRFDRGCCLLALGGGVIGDMTGFSAACYQRGVRFVQVPTTLLAQVDSSVGGKTAVNHPLGKNMIGAFHQPSAVIIDTNALDTLPAREYSAGLAEVVKYGAIRDPRFFAWLEENMPQLMARSSTALVHAIRESCRNKAEVVSADERESGQRALLNFGHTFGHAVETAMDYKGWLHGEAVACGMALAARLSVNCGMLAPAAAERLERLLVAANLPIHLPQGLDRKELLKLMRHDKKTRSGKLRLILLEALGQARIVGDRTEAEILAVLRAT
ncbi:MAG: 3-dehydroquinate synthase [Candidatus Eutrophobiaceae bacterium]